jgi:plastocyanin
VNHIRVLSTSIAALGLTVGLLACGDDDDSTASPSATDSTEETTGSAGATGATDGTDGTDDTGGGTATTAAPADGPTISIVGFDFGDPLSVAAGTSVTVVNESLEAHTLTADDGSFSTGELSPGASAVLVFDEPGTFTFHCAFHSSMQGSITVTA